MQHSFKRVCNQNYMLF